MSIDDDISYADSKKASINANLHEEFSNMLPTLIRLCHPDKHGNSFPSDIATSWLLKQKRIYHAKT